MGWAAASRCMRNERRGQVGVAVVVVVVAGAARHLEQEREKGELQQVGVLVLVD